MADEVFARIDAAAEAWRRGESSPVETVVETVVEDAVKTEVPEVVPVVEAVQTAEKDGVIASLEHLVEEVKDKL